MTRIEYRVVKGEKALSIWKEMANHTHPKQPWSMEVVSWPSNTKESTYVIKLTIKE